jgi:hypothetical protein
MFELSHEIVTRLLNKSIAKTTIHVNTYEKYIETRITFEHLDIKVSQGSTHTGVCISINTCNTKLLKNEVVNYTRHSPLLTDDIVDAMYLIGQLSNI